MPETDNQLLVGVAQLEADGVAELGGTGIFVAFDGRVVVVIPQKTLALAPCASISSSANRTPLASVLVMSVGLPSRKGSVP